MNAQLGEFLTAIYFQSGKEKERKKEGWEPTGENTVTVFSFLSSPKQILGARKERDFSRSSSGLVSISQWKKIGGKKRIHSRGSKCTWQHITVLLEHSLDYPRWPNTVRCETTKFSLCLKLGVVSHIPPTYPFDRKVENFIIMFGFNLFMPCVSTRNLRK